MDHTQVSGVLPKISPVIIQDRLEETQQQASEEIVDDTPVEDTVVATDMSGPPFPWIPKAALVKEIYARNQAAGWWPENRNLDSVKLLIISEIVEAFEEVRSNCPPVYIVKDGQKITIEHLDWASFSYTNGVTDEVKYHKPEGEVIECADVMIRCFDLVGHLGQADLFDESMTKFKFDQYPRGEDLEAKLYYGCVGLMTGQDYFFERLVAVVGAIYEYCHHRGFDLEKAIEIKLLYNLTRPHRHGGKRY